jgi:aryl-alcohol dehydrogenase-like predicted oxidoreductase
VSEIVDNQGRAGFTVSRAMPSTANLMLRIHPTSSAALDHGINLIDTARVYGNSEEIIGQAFEGMTSPPYIASKVFLSKDAAQKTFSALRNRIFSSIETSLRALKLQSSTCC